MKRNLILSGGVAHDFTKTSLMLSHVLEGVDIQSEILEDFGILEDRSLFYFDMVTLNCVRWTCSQPQISPDWQDK